ncbi:unnamed protein product [Brassica oleracea]
MEEELRNLIKVWISAFISISYCYCISSKISKGFLFYIIWFYPSSSPLSPSHLHHLSSDSSLLLFCPLMCHLCFLPHMARKPQARSLCF